MKNTQTTILVTLWIVCTCAVSADVGRAGQAGSYLRMGLGARQMGMGGGSVALGDDGFISYYNPAGVVALKDRHVVSSLRNMALDRKMTYFGYAQPVGSEAIDGKGPLRGGFAVGWLMASVDNIDSRDIDGQHLGMMSNGEHCFSFSFALKPNPKLAFGFSGKLIYNRFPDMSDTGDAFASTGFGFDLGVLYTPFSSISVGASLRDIRAKYTWDSKDLYDQGRQVIDRFPRQYRAGIAWNGLSGRLIVHADIEQTGIMPEEDDTEGEILYTPVQSALGFEWNPVDRISLRAGLYHNELTFGFGTLSPLFGRKSRLDYAYVADPVAPGDNHIFSWSFLF